MTAPDDGAWVGDVLRRVAESDPRLRKIRVDVRTYREFDPGECERYDAAVVALPAHARRERSLADIVDEFAHVRVPVVAALDSLDEPAGVQADFFIDRQTPAASFAGHLAILLERQEVINQMRRELKIAQRFQGGLRGEISRMHEELQLAALVQREFLPGDLPALHGIEFGAMWRPANYVSGDIYDIARLDEDHIGVFIADAVGHGVPAALMTMVIARALPTKDVVGNAYRLVPPGEALRRLNHEMIRRQGETTRFATAVYALINCRSRTVRIAGAGHPAPLLFRGDDAPIELDTPGGLLGVFEDETFDAAEVELCAGDRLLLYSDGFEVAFPVKNEHDFNPKMPTRRYMTEFAALANLGSPEEMLRELTKRVDAQPGSLHQTDDLTLICIHAGAVSGSIRQTHAAVPASR